MSKVNGIKAFSSILSFDYDEVNGVVFSFEVVLNKPYDILTEVFFIIYNEDCDLYG